LPAVNIIDAGPFTTVQDEGRYGFQRYGMAPAGAMDEVAYRLGNLILGNNQGEASLEFTLKGPRIKLLQDTTLVITGGRCAITVNGTSGYNIYEPLSLKSGDEVDIGWITEGARGYLAFRGGLDIPMVMQSYSTYLRGKIGGFEGARLKGGEILAISEPQGSPGRALPENLWPAYRTPFETDVIMGPQANYFTEEGINTFLSETYQISDAADRMGYRLTGPEIIHVDKADIISDGIPLGAIQVPGHRQPIILMKDRQTTGGYPKIATVASYEIFRLGQAKPGDQLLFKKVSLKEAKAKRELHKKWYDELASFILKPEQKSKHFRLTVNDKSYNVSIREID